MLKNYLQILPQKFRIVTLFLLAQQPDIQPSAKLENVRAHYE